MASQLAIVNNVLRELREDEVTSVADTVYSRLIANYVNRALAWTHHVKNDWSMYITEVDDTWPADGSTTSIAITETNTRARLMRDSDDESLPAVYDITSNELGQCIDYPHNDILKERALNTSGLTVLTPRAFSLSYDGSDDVFNMHIPFAVESGTTARNWRAYWYIPESGLSTNGDHDSTIIKMYTEPVVMYALYLATKERDEADLSILQEAEYALGAFIERDPQFLSREKMRSKDWSNNECL